MPQVDATSSRPRTENPREELRKERRGPVSKEAGGGRSGQNYSVKWKDGTKQLKGKWSEMTCEVTCTLYSLHLTE